MDFRKVIHWFHFGFIVLNLGCQSTPTKVYETHTPNYQELVRGLKEPIVIDSATIIIDARPYFEYAMAHLPGAISLQWNEFSETPQSGWLKADLDYSARRLSRLGITKESRVVIVGRGSDGEGEEGRLAWTLYFMGVRDVHFADIGYFKLRQTTVLTQPRKNAPVWKPEVDSSILITEKEFSEIKSSYQKGPVVLIDVRTEKEYHRSQWMETPAFRRFNIPFAEFFTQEGRPDPSMVKRLSEVGIARTAAIVVISQKGVRSAAVTMALLALGFNNVRNYAGGYNDLEVIH